MYAPVIQSHISIGTTQVTGSRTFLTPSRGYSFRSGLRPARRPRVRPPLCEVVSHALFLGTCFMARLKESFGTRMLTWRSDTISSSVRSIVWVCSG